MAAPVCADAVAGHAAGHCAHNVVERARKRPGLGGVLLGDDRVTMLVVGKIRAGVDLSALRFADVRVDGRRIHVTLPRAKVLSVELLPETSRIFDSQKSRLFSGYEGLKMERWTRRAAGCARKPRRTPRCWGSPRRWPVYN